MFILDEATSALDLQTEAQIIKILRSVSSQYTIIQVAHRLQTLRHSNVIFKVESGTLDIVESISP